jgi:hypothetical protein
MGRIWKGGGTTQGITGEENGLYDLKIMPALPHPPPQLVKQ